MSQLRVSQKLNKDMQFLMYHNFDTRMQNCYVKTIQSQIRIDIRRKSQDQDPLNVLLEPAHQNFHQLCFQCLRVTDQQDSGSDVSEKVIIGYNL